MRPITVIGVDAIGSVSEKANATLRNADHIFASRRLVELFADKRFTEWPKPFSKGVEQIRALWAEGASVVVLATGDPLHYGVGGTLARTLGADAVRCEPQPSAFSLAAARMGWPLEDCACISLHGSGSERSVASLERYVAPRRRIIALNRDGRTPAIVGQWLRARGFDESMLTVLEHLGAPDERKRSWTAKSNAPNDVADLSTLAIECEGDEAEWNGALPGLPDDAFANDSQLTKSDVRALTVSALKPFAGGVLWDVGAGCGSVAIEWLRSANGAHAFAIEAKPARCDLIRTNIERFGVGTLNVIEGEAPHALQDLPRPDAVFVGGGVSDPTVTESAFAALRVGGVFAANAVTLEGEAALGELHGRVGGRLRRISISHAEAIGGFRGWRSTMTVTMLTVRKTS